MASDASADELATAIEGADHFNFAGSGVGGNNAGEVHMLVACQNTTGGVNIADVEFENEGGQEQRTPRTWRAEPRTW